MYNILYYDLDKFSLNEVQEILENLKSQLPMSMANKTFALPEGTRLVNYYECNDKN